MARKVAPIFAVCLLGALQLPGVAADDCSDGDLVCDTGCYDTNNEACQAGVDETQCIELGSHVEWSPRCNCRCLREVCDMGCWDSEDEACHAGMNEMRCAEIYGHVEWAPKCNCRRSDGTEIINAVAEPKSGQVNLYFSPVTFIVLLRESLEVVIVLSIMLQFLNKSKENHLLDASLHRRLRWEIYVGASVGFFLVLCIGVGFLIAVAALKNSTKDSLGGQSAYYIEGIILICASFLLTYLALNFYKMVHTMEGHERKMRQRLQGTLEASNRAEQLTASSFGQKHAFLVFSFATGFREGMETIVFLLAVVPDLDNPEVKLPLSIVSALIVSRICGCIFFYSTSKARLNWFIRVISALLMFLAAGFFSSSIHNFQELEWFGTWSPRTERPWQNQRIFDASGCCNDKSNYFFAMMRALVGWQDQPTPIEVFSWLLYWCVAILWGTIMVRRAKRQLDELVARWKHIDAEAAEAEGKNKLAEELPPANAKDDATVV